MAMIAIKANKVNCFDVMQLGGQEVISWTNNGTNDEVIDVALYPSFLLNYVSINETHYQWCGPMLLIIEYFAKFTRKR